MHLVKKENQNQFSSTGPSPLSLPLIASVLLFPGQIFRSGRFKNPSVTAATGDGQPSRGDGSLITEEENYCLFYVCSRGNRLVA